MSIIEQLLNTNPATLSAMCTRDQFIASGIGETITSVSDVNGDSCDLPQLVFAHETDPLKNDFTAMFGKKVIILGTVEFWLIDEDCNEVIQFTDNTYGTYYTEGTWTETTAQSLYSGFVVDWWKVYDAFGGGVYKLKVKEPSLIVGQPPIERCSCPFMLTSYSDEKADQTVRIEVVFSSYYINSGEDYRGINWRQMYRVRGNFGLPEPKVDKDNYLNTDRKITDIQDKVYNEYKLETNHVPYCFTSEMMPTESNKSLASIADEIYITNYNLNDHFSFNEVPVVLKDIKLPGQTFNSNKVSFEMTFEDRDRRNVKRTVR